jgi:MFS family permease
MSLSKHNVRHLYWANLWGGSNFLEPVITFFYTLHGLNPTQLLFVLLSFSVSILVFEVPTGAFADRFGAKISFIMGCPVAHLFKSDFIRTCRFPGRMKRLLYESLKRGHCEKDMGNVMGKIQAASMFPLIVGLVMGGLI